MVKVKIKQRVAVFLFTFFTTFFVVSQIQAQINLQKIDTVFHETVMPGIYYTEYEVSSVPVRIFEIRVNRREQDVEFRTAKAGGQLAVLQTPSQMIEEFKNDSLVIIAGVNGDFYSAGGVPVNAQVIEGKLLKRPINRSMLLFDQDFKPDIRTVSFSGSVEFNNNKVPINGVNEGRGENELILFNSYSGTSTGTNSYGSEAGIRLLNNWVVNGTMTGVVEKVYADTGDISTENYDLLLSGHGTSSNYIKTYSMGDTLKIQQNLEPAGYSVAEAIGGSTQFLKNGSINSNWEERHPRTAIGFDKDSANVHFVVADGRQSGSAGLMLSELGAFMVSTGVQHAINLDGGGSSAIILRHTVLNDPSDGRERPVSNALFILVKSDENNSGNQFKKN